MSLHKIIHAPDLTIKLEDWKAQDKTIVFTNGCFDILHAGHVDYLEKAKTLGDVLIVGLNTDRSIAMNKGNDRPINDAFSRSRVLSSLQCVDAIVFFDEKTPYQLILSMMPDFLVKGSDYDIKEIVGADEVINAGGQVKTIELLEGFSTTSIINKIKRL